MNAAIETMKESEELFDVTLRHYDNSVIIETGTWEEVTDWRNWPQVVAWEVKRWDNVAKRNVVVAQSKSYHPSVIAWMSQENSKNVLGQSVVNDLLVDVQLERIYIYFTDTVEKFAPCIKIYNGTHLTIVGDVTLDNYDGFMKAVELAKRCYMRPF